MLSVRPNSPRLARCSGWRYRLADHYPRFSAVGQYAEVSLVVLCDPSVSIDGTGLAYASAGPSRWLFGRPILRLATPAAPSKRNIGSRGGDLRVRQLFYQAANDADGTPPFIWGHTFPRHDFEADAPLDIVEVPGIGRMWQPRELVGVVALCNHLGAHGWRCFQVDGLSGGTSYHFVRSSDDRLRERATSRPAAEDEGGAGAALLAGIGDCEEPETGKNRLEGLGGLPRYSSST